MIDWTKPIRRIADKAPARVICTDRKGTDRPICVLVQPEGHDQEYVVWLTSDGSLETNSEQCYENVPEKIVKWLNIYPDGNIYWHNTKEKADLAASNLMKRIACIKIEFEEGEGL